MLIKNLIPKLFVGFILSLPVNVNACSLVFWNTNFISPIVGRTMDLYIDDKPMIVVYPRGIERHGQAGENSISWTSKYGSVVINELNTASASEGINEVGLGASLLYLEETTYEPRDLSKPGLSIGQWAQYILDNYATVAEAVNDFKHFQVVPTIIAGRNWPIHLAIQDRTGDMAIVEYINGQMKVHHGPQYRIFTNEPTYDEQLSNLKKYKLFRGTESMPGDVDSLSRFVRASSYLKTLPQPNDEIEAVAFLMSVMRTVSVPEGALDTSGNNRIDAWPTRWITLKDLKHQVIYINVTKTPNIIWLDLHTLNFKRGSPILAVNPQNIELSREVQKELLPYRVSE